ncbi:MAG: DUF2782 domain-containing protein [Burkholderiales bacterium]|nr:DUF2782 domain-containing protein [Burkholderiales bacterium]
MLVLLCVCLPAWPQQPPRLDPLPEPPPPPAVAIEAPDEPAVRITPGMNEQVEELIVNGRRVIRVTNPNGAVYYLTDDPTNAERAGGLERRFSVPLWLIHSF